MTKRIISFLLTVCFIVVAVTACSPIPAADTDAQTVVPSATASNTTAESSPMIGPSEPYEGEMICVDIKDDYYGHFSTWADVTIHYYENEDGGCIDYIVIDNPTLLAFQIDEKHEGGLGTISGSEVEFLIGSLQEYSMRTEMSEEDAELFRQMLSLLATIGYTEGAST